MVGISVIIPTLNRESFLEKTVNYILEQDFVLPYEILIVDQSDEENQLMAELCRKTPEKIQYHYITFFKGLPEARNYGVQHAKYDYILFLDDDIECDKTLLTEHYKFLSQEDIAIVTGGVTEKFKRNVPAKHIGKFHYFTANPEGGFHIDRSGYVEHIKGGNYSIKKDIFIKAGGVDEYLNFGAALYEETELSLRVQELGYKIYFNYAAHIWHLAAATGGCRVTEINKYIKSLVHNRALVITRHLKWYHKPIARLYLFRLVASYAFTYRKPSLLKLYFKSYKQGSKEGKLKPKYTNFEENGSRQ